MKFRVASLADVEAIYKIEKEVQPNSWNLEQVRGEVERAHSLLAVSDNDQIEGYLFFRGGDGQFDLTNIALASANFGTGLGGQLLGQMIKEIKSESTEITVLLEVSSSNLRAMRFYQKFGFKPLSIRPRYYSDGSDAHVMLLCISKD